MQTRNHISLYASLMLFQSRSAGGISFSDMLIFVSFASMSMLGRVVSLYWDRYVGDVVDAFVVCVVPGVVGCVCVDGVVILCEDVVCDDDGDEFVCDDVFVSVGWSIW